VNKENPLTKEILEKGINTALDRLYNIDEKLFPKACERCIMFKFATYFEKWLACNGFLSSELTLDVEYNRHLVATKITKNRPQGSAPDLIIHERGNDNQNIFVLEAKKSSRKKSDLEKDTEKIRAYINEYGYKFGATLVLGENRETSKVKFI